MSAEYIGHNNKILIVDDNQENLAVLFDYLYQTGFTVLVAQNGEDALRVVEKNPPDLILLDVLMPGMDGFETCRRLKADEHSQAIPVIFMTALTDTLNKVKGFEAGGVDYITKPIQCEEVLARIKAHLTIQNLQQNLQQQNEELQRVNASKDKFFSIIAHDLRGPFSGLLGVAQILLDGLDTYDTEQIRDIMKKVKQSAETLYALLENLLTWSRIQRGVIDYHPEYIKISYILERNVQLFRSNAEQKQVQLHAEIEELPLLFADGNMIDTVIRNLLSNAIKFTPPGGTITLTTAQTEDEIRVTVQDTGIGIRQDNLERLFKIDEKFQRHGTEGEEGTGLGLILCQDLIEKNGGQIGVESECGQGSTFWFTIPITSDGEEAEFAEDTPC